MKSIYKIVFLIGIVFSSNAYALFFFFIPTGAIADAITGSKGDTCLKEGYKVGDVITSESGNTAKILSLSGTSRVCPNHSMPIRAEVEYKILFNSKAGFEIPDNPPDDFRPGFVKKDLKPLDYFNGQLFFATRNNPESYMMISAFKKKISLDQAISSVITQQQSRLSGHTKSEILDLVINGSNAKRVEINGVFNNKKLSFLITVIEGKEEFVKVNQWCNTDNFIESKPYFIKIADSVTGINDGTTVANPEQTTPKIKLPNTQITKSDNTNLIQTDALKKLQELKELLDRGIINQNDYDSKKQQILKSM